LSILSITNLIIFVMKIVCVRVNDDACVRVCACACVLGK